jgi:hypothetical protein
MAVLHVVCIDNTRNLWHTIRRLDGTWFPFGPVRNVVLGENPGSLNPGPFDDVACAGVVNDLHVCLLTTTNQVVHTIRSISGSWTPFGDVLSVAQAPGGNVFSIAAAQVNGQLQVAAAIQRISPPIISIDKEFWRTIRGATGAWRQFENVGGSFDDVACTEAGGQFHFCGTTFDSQGIRQNLLEHALRPSGGSFTPFGDVRGVVLAENPGSMDPGLFHLVSCAGFAGELHVCAISSGRLFHTVRRTNGTWFPFGDVVGVVVAENPGSPQPVGLGNISCAIVNGELHVICVDNAGMPWHTIRRADGTWFPFGNMRDVVLAENPGSPVPGPILSVSIAYSF